MAGRRVAGDRPLDVPNIIWCTGFREDFGWIDLPIFDEHGHPIHRRGVVDSAPGVYFLGQEFLYAMASATLPGVARDARYLADHIADPPGHPVEGRSVQRHAVAVAVRPAAAVRRALRNLPIPPGQVAGIAVALALGRIVPLIPPGRRAISRAAGMAAIGAGAGLNLWALRERARHAGGSFDLEHPDTLVTSGPYARSRHPMYVGWWLIHAGVGWSAGSAWVLVTLPIAVLVEHPFVVAEERRLVRDFSAQGERYVASVPRYLPLTLARPARSVGPLRVAAISRSTSASPGSARPRHRDRRDPGACPAPSCHAPSCHRVTTLDTVALTAPAAARTAGLSTVLDASRTIWS